VKIDPAFREAHVLADGTRLTLRLIRPEDGEALRQAFARLSPATRVRRFLGGVTELSDEQVRYLTEIDGVDHVAIVAATDSHDLKTEVLLGVARFIRLAGEPEVAEAAVVVADELQGRGIGRLLLRAIAEAARALQIRALRAEVLASNTPMRRILGDVGAVMRSDDGATLVFDVPLTSVEQEEKEGLLRRLLRAAAAIKGG
jgi:GNAT superfamily N-acetyltransferase